MNKICWKGRAFKALSYGKNYKKAGRNFSGSITIFHRGGGAKRLLRRIDFQRQNLARGFIERIEYDPNRTARIALVRWAGNRLLNDGGDSVEKPERAGIAGDEVTGPSSANRFFFRGGTTGPFTGATTMAIKGADLQDYENWAAKFACSSSGPVAAAIESPLPDRLLESVTGSRSFVAPKLFSVDGALRKLSRRRDERSESADRRESQTRLGVDCGHNKAASPLLRRDYYLTGGEQNVLFGTESSTSAASRRAMPFSLSRSDVGPTLFGGSRQQEGRAERVPPSSAQPDPTDSLGQPPKKSSLGVDKVETAFSYILASDQLKSGDEVLNIDTGPRLLLDRRAETIKRQTEARPEGAIAEPGLPPQTPPHLRPPRLLMSPPREVHPLGEGGQPLLGEEVQPLLGEEVQPLGVDLPALWGEPSPFRLFRDLPAGKGWTPKCGLQSVDSKVWTPKCGLQSVDLPAAGSRPPAPGWQRVDSRSSKGSSRLRQLLLAKGGGPTGTFGALAADVGPNSYYDREGSASFVGPGGVAGSQPLFLSTANLYQKSGISLPLWLAPIGSVIHNIELYPGGGGKLARAAGTSAQLVKKEPLAIGPTKARSRRASASRRWMNGGNPATLFPPNVGPGGQTTPRGQIKDRRPSPPLAGTGFGPETAHYGPSLCTIRLPSGQQQLLDLRCRATIGVVSNIDHRARILTKAGQRRWQGFRPVVRGVAMNPIDHPHGGGEGRTKGGRPSVSPWGKPTKAGFRGSRKGRRSH